MISARELNPKGYVLTREQKVNFDRLLSALNTVREHYGSPMFVTSGVRSEQDQLRINPDHPGSAHTLAAAADIRDHDGKFWQWCLSHLDLLESLGIYLEAKAWTREWVHLQIIPPKSGRRIFIP